VPPTSPKPIRAIRQWGPVIKAPVHRSGIANPDSKQNSESCQRLRAPPAVVPLAAEVPPPPVACDPHAMWFRNRRPRASLRWTTSATRRPTRLSRNILLCSTPSGARASCWCRVTPMAAQWCRLDDLAREPRRFAAYRGRAEVSGSTQVAGLARRRACGSITSFAGRSARSRWCDLDDARKLSPVNADSAACAALIDVKDLADTMPLIKADRPSHRGRPHGAPMAVTGTARPASRAFCPRRRCGGVCHVSGGTVVSQLPPDYPMPGRSSSAVLANHESRVGRDCAPRM